MKLPKQTLRRRCERPCARQRRFVLWDL